MLLEVVLALVSGLIPVSGAFCSLLFALLDGTNLCFLGIANAYHTEASVGTSNNLSAPCRVVSFHIHVTSRV